MKEKQLRELDYINSLCIAPYVTVKKSYLHTICYCIKYQRKKQNITQEELSNKTGISTSIISNIENYHFTEMKRFKVYVYIICKYLGLYDLIQWDTNSFWEAIDIYKDNKREAIRQERFGSSQSILKNLEARKNAAEAVKRLNNRFGGEQQ